MTKRVSRTGVIARTSLIIAVLAAGALAIDGGAVAQPKPPAGAGSGTPPTAGALAVPEGMFTGPSREGKANGKGRLTLRSGLVVEEAE
jgi:hypothetical protein